MTDEYFADVTTTTTSIAGLQASEIVSKQIAVSLHATPSIFDTVWYEGDIAGSKVVKFRKSTAMVAGVFDEQDGMPLTEYDPAGVQVTVGPVGITTRVTDFAGILTPEVAVKVGEEQGNSIATKIDTDLAALFASFTASVGTTNTAITVDNYLAAIAGLNTNLVPQNDRVAVLSPGQYTDLLKAANVLNQFATTGTMSTGVLPVLFGIQVRMSQLLAKTGGSSVDAIGAVYQRTAIGFGQAGTLKVDVQRAPAIYAATDIATACYYGVGLIDAARGVKIVCKK